MKLTNWIVLIAASAFIGFYLKNNLRDKKKFPQTIERLKKKSTYQFIRLRERLEEKHSNTLLLNPEHDIKIRNWEKETALREKTNIHRTRLKKFGKSKFNGKLFFKGPKGGVFIYTANGRKKYI